MPDRCPVHPNATEDDPPDQEGYYFRLTQGFGGWWAQEYRNHLPCGDPEFHSTIPRYMLGEGE